MLYIILQFFWSKLTYQDRLFPSIHPMGLFYNQQPPPFLSQQESFSLILKRLKVLDRRRNYSRF